MSASILYHAFNIKNVKYKGIEYSGEGIIVKVEMSRYIPCPGSGDRYPTFKGQKTRRLRMSHMGRKRCYLDLVVHRVKSGSAESSGGRNCLLWWARTATRVRLS